MTQTQAETLGPVSYLVVEFAGTAAPGTGFPVILDLVDRGLIRVLDLSFVAREQDGSVRALDLHDLDRDGHLDLEVFNGASSEMLDERDFAEAASVLEPGSSAAILVFENSWAIPLVQAIRRGGGELVAAGYVAADALSEALDASERSPA